MNTLKNFRKTCSRLESILILFCAAFLMFIVVIVCVQVIARALNISLSGSEELARYSYVSFVFLAWPIAALRGTDMRVSVLSDLLPRRARTILMGIFNLVMAGYAALTVYSLFGKIGIAGEVVAASNTWLKMKWLYFIIMAGLLLTVAANLIRAVMLLADVETVKTQSEQNEEEIAAELENTRAVADRMGAATQEGETGL